MSSPEALKSRRIVPLVVVLDFLFAGFFSRAEVMPGVVRWGQNLSFSAAAVIDELIHVTELSGGLVTATSISEVSMNRFEQGKSCFQR